MLDKIDASGEAVDPRAIPRDGERNRRVEQHAEVVAVVRVLVEVPEIGDDPAAERLLDAEFDLIALPGGGGVACAEQRHQAVARRQQQVLVVRRLHRAAVRRAQHRVAAPERRTRRRAAAAASVRGGQTVVVIQAQAELERRVAGLDVVLNVGGLLLDRRRLAVVNGTVPPLRQIEASREKSGFASSSPSLRRQRARLRSSRAS